MHIDVIYSRIILDYIRYIKLENDEYLYEYQAELFQTLHEHSYLLRAHHTDIVCLQHGWFWNKNI